MTVLKRIIMRSMLAAALKRGKKLQVHCNNNKGGLGWFRS
jgi:hypothetical protein